MLLFFLSFFFCRGQDPPEKPSVIKTESLSSEEPNVNQIIIQDDATSSITTYNGQRAQVQTDTSKRNIAAGLSNNNRIGNTGKHSENRGQLKPQGLKGNRGVKGVFPANSSRDFNSYGTDSKIEKVCKQEFFDDDDDILAAVADDDYFVLEEDFDMEEIDQLEIGVQNTNSTTDKRSTTSNVIASGNNNLEMSYDDVIFEDDFEAEDLLAEAADSLEIKPLHERICSEQTMGAMHVSKKSKISNSSTMEFNSNLRNTNSSNKTNIQTPSDVNPRKAKDTSSTLNSVRTEPISLMNNATFNSCSVFINTGPCCESRNAGGLKLSSKKTNVVTNSSLSSARPSFSKASNIQIRKEPENEAVSGHMNNTVTPMVADTNQHQSTVIHNIHGKQGNVE